MGPNSKSDISTHMVSRSSAGILGVECGTSSCHFKSPDATALEDSTGLPEECPIQLSGLGNRRLFLTGSLRCALRSTLRGDDCTAVDSVPGDYWDLTLNLTITLTITLNPNLTISITLDTPNYTRPYRVVRAWNPKTNSDKQPPLCTDSALRGDNCIAVGTAPGSFFDLP